MQELSIVLEKLEIACKNTDYVEIRQILLEAPTGFKPATEIVDILYDG